MCQKLIATLKKAPKLTAVLKKVVIKEYPELENLIITPSNEEQKFKSSKYGFNEVICEKVKGKKLEITPTMEKQNYKGLFEEVNVDEIQAEELIMTPNNETQVKEGLFNKVTVEAMPETGGGSSDVKINNGYYLFYSGARTTNLYEILSICENISSMERMFSGCASLTELDLSNLDMSNVESMAYTFYGCSKLSSLDFGNMNTSNLTSIRSAFHNCQKLTSLDLSNLDMSNVNNVNGAFNACIDLENLKGFKNLGKGYTQKTANNSNYTLNLSYSDLTVESLLDIINNLYDLNLTYDVANGGTLYTQTLQLGSGNKNKLTTDEIAIATNKGWTVS